MPERIIGVGKRSGLDVWKRLFVPATPALRVTSPWEPARSEHRFYDVHPTAIDMLVIVNSDVLFTTVFVHQRVHRSWREFAAGCRSVNAEMVFPRTALYEIELRQKELYDGETRAIESASALLKKYGVEVDAPPPQELIKTPDIVQLFRDTGVAVRIEDATLEDFRDAERRAAMHL